MNFDKSACVGVLIGYFVVMGVINLTPLNPINALLWGIAGLSLAIFFGLTNITNYFKA
jgi:hypothetical protein